MATVTGLTAARMLAIEAASVVDGEIDVNGHLILTRHDASEIDAGYMIASVPDASQTVKGLVELATAAETITGMDDTKAVTPAGFDEAALAAIALHGLHYISANDFDQATMPIDYPQGESLMYLSSADATAGGWTNFVGKWGHIRSIQVTSGGDVSQIWRRVGDPSAQPEAWVRAGNNVGWMPWEQLAFVEDGEKVLVFAPSPAESDLPSAYPIGVSVSSVSSNESTWSINGSNGTVLTVVRLATNRAFQIFHSNDGGAGTPQAWLRSYHNSNDGGGWTAWVEYHLDAPAREDRTSAMTVGTWYRIATLNSSSFGEKASALFTITTEGSGFHEIFKIRASSLFGDALRSSLIVEHCAGYGSNNFPSIDQVRLVRLDSADISGGAAIDVRCAATNSGQVYDIKAEHDNFPNGTRWVLTTQGSTPTAPSAPAVVQLTRGIGYMGDFIPVTFANSWVNFGSTFAGAGYRMEPGGVVRIRGLIKSGTVSSTLPAFTLPPGYRPKFQCLHATSANGAIGRIDILTDGRVCITNAASTAFVQLDGLSFLAEG